MERPSSPLIRMTYAEDIITLVDDWTGTNGNYQVKTQNIPFKAGNMMTGSIWRVTAVGS
ncbi:hypothetical protein [Alicyclobacillus dauci]|uniref:Uncharacterized protein n=1 Tax=Alicyclobacillus dauci TaxID=1475485 RepID=A0ABY6YZZ5_9BACL|nr:hypothetical protein [Alicyclobacillus dauci]WAH35285.1 hypothetical protein NZD86_13300 [Alicyclobacillus dauci]